ncbi:hypothetical protein ACH4UR_37240 [Streptomyces lydicus]|uniref:hypothetical protein n=1 Tax=Streptomyces lydicus TaxID=47763 RepID=UPI0033F22571
MSNSKLKYDPTSPEGRAIGCLFRRLHQLGDDWVDEWFSELGVDVDGPAWQVNAIQPEAVSPANDPRIISELLDKEPGFTRQNRRLDLTGYFYATYDEPSFFDEHNDDETVVVVFPYATAARLRAAVSVLRQAGYTTTAYDSDQGGYNVRVNSGTVYNLPDDAPVADRANRLLWAAGFTCTDSPHAAHLPSHTTPLPIPWRPDWFQIDVISACTTDDRNEETARAISATLKAAGWRVDERGAETLHTTPFDAAGADRTAAVEVVGEPTWQYGDVVLDAVGEVWTRASTREREQGWPWAHGAATTLISQGHPYSTQGGSREDEPVRPLTLLVRNGKVAQATSRTSQGAATADEATHEKPTTAAPLLPAHIRASITAIVEEHWADEQRDYQAQDPADREGHAFVHLFRINNYLGLGLH